MKARLFIPVLVTALAACLGGCGDQAQDGTLRDKLRELEDSHQETQAELARLLEETQAVQDRSKAMQAERDQLQARLDAALQKIEELRKGRADGDRQEQVAQTSRTPGTSLGSLSVNGRKFDNVIVREVTGTSLAFRHQGGTISVPLSQLPVELQKQLGYTPPPPAAPGAPPAPASGAVQGAAPPAPVVNADGLAPGLKKTILDPEEVTAFSNPQIAEVDKVIKELRARLAVFKDAEAKGIKRVWDSQKAAQGGDAAAANAAASPAGSDAKIRELEAELQSALELRDRMVELSGAP